MLRQLSQETGGRVFFPTTRRRAAEDLRADLRRAREPVQHRLLVEEPDAQRRLAPHRRPRGQARTDGAHATGLLRPDGSIGHRHASAAARRSTPPPPPRMPPTSPGAIRESAGSPRRCSAPASSPTPSSSACRRCRRATRRSSARPRRFRRSCGCSGLSYLYVELTTDERAMGVFVTVLLAVLAIIPALDPTIAPRPPLLQSPLFTVHVHVGALRLRELRARLRARHDLRAAVQGNQGEAPRLLLRAPAVAAGARHDERPRDHGRLDVPDRRRAWSAASGRRRSQASPDPRAQAMSIADPKILVALLSWGVYSFALFARRRRSAGAAGARRGCRRSRSCSCS